MSKDQAAFPPWMTIAITTALIGTLITGAWAWTARQTAQVHNHETRISVTETRVDGIDKSLDELKQGQQRMEDKLDRALRRR